MPPSENFLFPLRSEKGLIGRNNCFRAPSGQKGDQCGETCHTAQKGEHAALFTYRPRQGRKKEPEMMMRMELLHHFFCAEFARD